MWMRCASGQQWQAGHCAGAPRSLNWLEAKASAEQINRQGAAFYSDWRVPSLRELATLSERQCKNPRINLAVFPDTPAAAFWTATLPPGRSEDKAAFAMDFGAAGVQAQDKQDSGHVRLVRNAQ